MRRECEAEGDLSDEDLKDEIVSTVATAATFLRVWPLMPEALDGAARLVYRARRLAIDLENRRRRER